MRFTHQQRLGAHKFLDDWWLARRVIPDSLDRERLADTVILHTELKHAASGGGESWRPDAASRDQIVGAVKGDPQVRTFIDLGFLISMFASVIIKALIEWLMEQWQKQTPPSC